MRYTDPDELRTLVSAAVSGSRYAGRFKGADVEASDHPDDGGVIRIIVRFSDLDDIPEDDIDMITSLIERVVTMKDDRFPSVRFSEP